MKTMSLTSRSVISSTVGFLNIPGLKDLRNAIAFSAIVCLHEVLADWRKRSEANGVEILSSLTGAILIVPDLSNFPLHAHLPSLGKAIANRGIPVRLAIAHGEIELLDDIDDQPNFVGVPINMAARLATQENQPHCIVHGTYKEFISGRLDSDKVMDGSAEVGIIGKPHDGASIRAWLVTPSIFPTAEAGRLDTLQTTQNGESINAVALGFDLPKFSAGDRSALSKRFRSIVDVFHAIQTEGMMGEIGKMYFSPGGDGGILVGEMTKRAGFFAAQRLASLLEVESVGRHDDTQVNTRIGLHYGAVTLYKNASEITRPTGRICFIADSLAADQDPSAGNGISVVISEAFIDAAGAGSWTKFAQEFVELPTLQKGSAKDVRRFVAQRTRPIADRDPLFEKLTGRKGSWEPKE